MQDILTSPRETLAKIFRLVKVENTVENSHTISRALNRANLAADWQGERRDLFFIDENGLNSRVIEGMPGYVSEIHEFYNTYVFDKEMTENRKETLKLFIEKGFCNESGKMNWELFDSQEFRSESAEIDVDSGLNYQ
jgi:hypothetical protein